MPDDTSMTTEATQGKPRATGHITEAGMRLTFFPENALKDWRLGRAELRVLVALSAFTDGKTGLVRPAQETIAEMAGLTRPKVNVLIKDLCALGYLVQWKRSRCWTYLVLNPEIPTQGNAPRGGTLPKSDTTAKKFQKGGQDHVPTGGTPHVPTGGTQTPRTLLNKKKTELRTGSTPEHIEGADPEGPLVASALSAKGRCRKFTPPKGLFSAEKATRAAYSPVTQASQHLSRQDLPELMTLCDTIGTEAALKHFNLDYAGRPIKNDQIDLEECLEHAPGKATQTKKVNHG